MYWFSSYFTSPILIFNFTKTMHLTEGQILNRLDKEARAQYTSNEVLLVF